MAYDPGLHHRRSVRLHGYDYAQNGAYFVTLCTHGRARLFGTICADADSPSVELNEAGTAVLQCWLEIPQHFPQVVLDSFVIMPDHVHGILLFAGGDPEPGRASGANDYSPLQNGTSKSVGSVVRGFKIGVTKWFRHNHPETGEVWQRSYYEHVIRNEQELHAARQYIAENPAKMHDRPL